MRIVEEALMKVLYVMHFVLLNLYESNTTGAR